MNRVSLGNKVNTSQRGQSVKFLTAVDFVLLTKEEGEFLCGRESFTNYPPVHTSYSNIFVLKTSR